MSIQNVLKAKVFTPKGGRYLTVFHNSVSVFIPPWKGGRIPESIGPTTVARARQIPNGSGSFGKYARTSDDPYLQGGCGLLTKRMARETRSDARVASEGPRPTVKGGFSPPVARGPVPRDRWIARTISRPGRDLLHGFMKQPEIPKDNPDRASPRARLYLSSFH